MSCATCNGTGWRERNGGMAKCSCRIQREGEHAAGTPLTSSAAMGAMRGLEALSFFPEPGPARIVIADAFMSMCRSLEQAQWLVRRAVALHATWGTCGVPGLRQIVSARYIPADGVSLSITEAYPEGVPSENAQSHATPLLTPGKEESRRLLTGVRQNAPVPTADELAPIQAAIERKRPPKPPVLAMMQAAGAFTQEDIDKAKREYQRKKTDKAALAELDDEV